VNWSHQRVTTGGRAYSLLSRTAASGLDYSGRNNKLAHMLLVEPAERVPAGPAWCLAQSGVMEREWTGEPRILPQGRRLPNGSAPARVCSAWEAMTGDAGWAGALAEAFLADPSRPAYLFFEPGCDLLPLFEEAIALLPEGRRWDATFSTYFTSLSPNVECQWRCVVKGSAEANESRRFVKALRIDLTTPQGRAEGGALVEWARTGRDPRTTGVAPVMETEAGAEGQEFPTWTGEPNDGLIGGMPRVTNEPENVPGATARGPQRNVPGGVGAEYRLGTPAYTLPGQVPVPPPPGRRVAGRGRGWFVAVLCIVASIAAAAGGSLILLGRPGPKIEPPVFALNGAEPMVVVIGGEATTVRLLDSPPPPGWKMRFVKEPLAALKAKLNGETLTIEVSKDSFAQPSAHEVGIELAYDMPAALRADASPLLKLPVLIVPKVKPSISPLLELNDSEPPEFPLLEHTGPLERMTLTAVITDSKGKNAEGISFNPAKAAARIEPKTAKSGAYDIQLTAAFPQTTASKESTLTYRMPKITLTYTSPQKPEEMAKPVEAKPTGPTVLNPLELTFTRGRGFKVQVITGAKNVTLSTESTLPDGVKLSALGYLEGAPAKAGQFEFQCVGMSNGDSVLQKVLVTVHNWHDKSVVEAASDRETPTEQLLALPQATFDPTTASFTIPKDLSNAFLLDIRLHMPSDTQAWKTTRSGSADVWNIGYAEAGTQDAGAGPKAYYKIEVHRDGDKAVISITALQERAPSETPDSVYLLSLAVLEFVYSTGHSRLFTLAPAIPAKSGQLLGSGFELSNEKWERYVGSVLGRLYPPGDGTAPQKLTKVVLKVSAISLHQPETAPKERLYAKPVQPDNAGAASTPEQTLHLSGSQKDDLVLATIVPQNASLPYPAGISSCELVLRNNAGRKWIGAAFTFDAEFLNALDKEKRLIGRKSFETDGVLREWLREPLSSVKSDWASEWGIFSKRLKQECPSLTSLHKAFEPMNYAQALIGLDDLQKISEDNKDDIEIAEKVIRRSTNNSNFAILPTVVFFKKKLMAIKAAEETINWVDRVRNQNFSMQIDLEYAMDSPEESLRVRRRLIEIKR
jgi:hypothetical protein